MLDGTSYRVVRELGAGGMGVVYEIEHVRLKKRYVAKVIHDQIKNEDGAAKRMEREAQVLAAISHPNIVQVHDVGTTQDGVSYFVMEKLEGVDLRSTMKHGLTRIRAIEIVTDVLDALEYVHRRGIVHRDIKPENIFLSEQPTGTVTKVLDFGIVHIFDSDGRVSQGRITKTGGFVGTLYYAAPEQMQGKPAGPPNDIYAAGLVLFELLAGKGPFDDDPGVGLSRCFKPAPLLTELVPQAPPALTHAVARALDQDPTRRPSAGALATELRAVAASLKSTPGAVEEDAIRAEVHDLLRHMPLDDIPAPRPAAGRPPTVEPEPLRPVAVDAAPAAEATAVPPTPVMAGAPGRPSDPRARLDATLASPGAPTHDSGAGSPALARPAAGQPPAPTPAPHPPTLPGVGIGAQRGSSPDTPLHGPSLGGGSSAHPARAPAGEHAPMAASAIAGQAGPAPPAHAHRGSSPGAAVPPNAPPNAHVTPSVSAPPPSPGFPAAAGENGRVVPPANAADAAHLRASQPAQAPPLFASTIAVQQAHRKESTPNPPGHQGDTSPGVYATIDSQPLSTPLPKRTPWAAIAAAAGAIVLVIGLIGGAVALRHKGPSTTTGTSPSSDTSAGPPVETKPAGSRHADAPAGSASIAPPTGTTSGMHAPAAETRHEVTATATVPPKTNAAEAPPSPPPQPTLRANTPGTAPKPAAPAAPRNGSSPQGAEKDGYVKTL